jgi:5-methylthioribose kinase
MLGTRSTLVLGDYAPKNAFAYPGRLLILDFEVAHWGDPAFDPAFCLTHLLLKTLHFRDARYLRAADLFWRAYTAGRGEVDEVAVLRELGCLLLARVDGKSQAEYLVDEAVREDVRELGRRFLTGEAMPMTAALQSVALGPAPEPAA